jgi:hypothetical protein
MVGKSIGKIGGVQQAESTGGQEVLLLASFGRLANQLGGIPLGEEDLLAPGFQPLEKKLDLCALSRAVNSFHDNEFPLPEGTPFAGFHGCPWR